jgi:hypothetical protein
VRKTKAILIWSVAVCATIAFSGCLKTSEPAKTPAQAYISVLHLATTPNTPSVEVYFDAKKVSEGFLAGSVSPTYSAVDKGFFSINFKKTGSDSLVASLPADQYDSLGFYTIMLYNQPGGSASAALIVDDYSDLTLDKPFIRFFHASPGISNLGNVDVWMDDVKVTGLSGRTLADNQYGGFFNEYQGTTTGNHKFQVKLSSNDSTLATLNDAGLIAGNAYTLYLKGNPGGTGANQVALGLLRAAN